MNFRYLLILAAFCCLGRSLYASDYQPSEIHYFSDYFEIPNYMAFAEGDQPDLTELNSILAEHWEGSENFDLRLKSTYEDRFGELHHKYVQTYRNIDIELAELIVHSRNGKIYALNGKLISKQPLVREVRLTEADALQSALDHIGAQSYKWEIPEEEDFLKELEGNPAATYFPEGELKYISPAKELRVKELRLCYRFNIYAHEPMSRREVFVDAESGEVILNHDLIHTSNVSGSAVTGYSGTHPITTDSVGPNTFRLRQTALGNGVNTYDLNTSTIFGSAVDFTDADNIWNNANAQLDQYATDAHWGAEQTYNYFFSKFQRNSINNSGFALNSYVHYGSNYANAFWNGQYMTYGDGGNGVTPLTALDIAGHEIAHGLTTFSADLIYEKESGALNESFSDIFGAAIEFYSKPNQANWTLGEDIGFIIRSMSNPNSYNDPDTYGGTFWLNQVGCVPSNQNDNCGVHINSGVQNFWFYLLCNGGSGMNDNGNAYTVSSIGIAKAEAIAYRNLTVYLGRSSDYDEARFYSIKSAIDLYGSCSQEVEAVTRAWYAVGVGPDYINRVEAAFTSSDSISCQAPLTVSFNNESANGISFFWDFGDGTTDTSLNPVHTYTQLGQYNVTLQADGGSCGADTLLKTAYIDLDTNNSCVAFLNNGSNPKQLDCSGTLYDSGGSTGAYSNNENGTITIAPPNASSVTLSFNNFNVEGGTAPGLCDYDYLEIFDGDSTNTLSLGKFCNNVSPPTTITSSRGAITLRFSSDQGLALSGFDISWSCNYPSAAPTADFSYDQDSSCTGQVQFRDLSNQGANSWIWDFGDGRSSTLRDPSHTYTADGTYTVSLVSANSFGSDTVIKSNIIYIDRPLGPLVQNDTACQGQSASLSATGNGTLRWFNSEFGGAPINTGNNLNLIQPQNDTTFWVEDFIQAPTSNLGPFSPAIGNGGYFSGDRTLIFDVYQTLILTDVFVNAVSNGSKTIELRDSAGNVLQSKTVNLANSGNLFNVNLDFRIEPGNNYQLGVDNSSGPDLYRNSNGAQYPYTVPGMLSIKRSSANTNPLSYYYFFYYWRVREPNCVSPRVPVVSSRDTSSACTITALEEQSLTMGVQIYPNPVREQLFINIPSHRQSLSVELWSLEGKKLMDLYRSPASTAAQNKQIDLGQLAAGVYLVRIGSQTNQQSMRLVITK